MSKSNKSCNLDVEDMDSALMSAEVEDDASEELCEPEKMSDSEYLDDEELLDAADGDPEVMDSIHVDDDDEFMPDDDEDEEEEDDEDITDERGEEPDGADGTLPPVKEGRENLNTPPVAPAVVSLRSNDIGRGLKPTVDRATNAIRNVSVMQKGPALGHGFVIDEKMLNQVADQMKGGVPMRFKHPQQMGPDGQMTQTDSLGTHVGKVTNVRRIGDDVRGDIEFGPHAKHVPMMGDVQSYLMDLADHDPSAFGLSTVFAPDDYERDSMGNPVGRSKGVVACDLTGEPASNRNGLI